MSAWLLDTHALIWFLNGVDRLSPTAREIIEPRGNRVLVSAASIWEMAIKSGLGKLTSPDDPIERLEGEGFETLAVTAEHAWGVSALPHAHRDPFDRLLAAQALRENIPIISADPVFERYGVKRVW